MSETVETCGKAYCEHYPDGLFVCAECREASTRAHDIACALLADARAEIEHLKQELCDNSTLAARQIVPAEMLVDDLAAEIERKDALIEQMREALEACAEFIHYYDQEHNIGDGKVLEQATAALSAAERGE